MFTTLMGLAVATIITCLVVVIIFSTFKLIEAIMK